MSVINLPILIGALLFVLCVLGIVLQLRKLDEKLERVIAIARQDRDPNSQKKPHAPDLRPMIGDLQKDLGSLRKSVDRVLSEAMRLRQQQSIDPPLRPAARFDPEPDEMPEVFEDGVARLTAIANRNLHQNSSTLEAFEAKVEGLASRVWARPSDVAPVVFIVEHRGVCYAIPNVVKPARLPESWFNRADFGFNDEIRDVISLPRLIRRGDNFDVEQTGVFER
jgi:hypothetical protein